MNSNSMDRKEWKIAFSSFPKSSSEKWEASRQQWTVNQNEICQNSLGVYMNISSVRWCFYGSRAKKNPRCLVTMKNEINDHRCLLLFTLVIFKCYSNKRLFSILLSCSFTPASLSSYMSFPSFPYGEHRQKIHIVAAAAAGWRIGKRRGKKFQMQIFSVLLRMGCVTTTNVKFQAR